MCTTTTTYSMPTKIRKFCLVHVRYQMTFAFSYLIWTPSKNCFSSKVKNLHDKKTEFDSTLSTVRLTSTRRISNVGVASVDTGTSGVRALKISLDMTCWRNFYIKLLFRLIVNTLVHVTQVTSEKMWCVSIVVILDWKWKGTGNSFVGDRRDLGSGIVRGYWHTLVILKGSLIRTTWLDFKFIQNLLKISVVNLN